MATRLAQESLHTKAHPNAHTQARTKYWITAIDSYLVASGSQCGKAIILSNNRSKFIICSSIPATGTPGHRRPLQIHRARETKGNFLP